jgi:Haem-binding domain
MTLSLLATLRFAALVLFLTGCSEARPASTARTLSGDPVRDEYVLRVEPIFAKSCFDCHGSSQLPWYHAIPVVRGLIDRDVKDAKYSINLTQGYPFPGRGRQADYLDLIEGVLDDKSMPPWHYRVVHWSAALDDAQRQVIRDWIESARAKRAE